MIQFGHPVSYTFFFSLSRDKGSCCTLMVQLKPVWLKSFSLDWALIIMMKQILSIIHTNKVVLMSDHNLYCYGPGCSKLTTSLVNLLLKF